MVLLGVVLTIRTDRGRQSGATTDESSTGAAIAVAASSEPLTAEQPAPSIRAVYRTIEWIDLFNGRDVTGRLQIGQGTWTVENGTIFAAGGTGKLIHDDQFRDFELSMKVFTTSRSNGGVFVHLPRDANPDAQGYEVQVAGSQGDPGSNYTGGIYEGGQIVQRVDPPLAPDDRWVQM